MITAWLISLTFTATATADPPKLLFPPNELLTDKASVEVVGTCGGDGIAATVGGKKVVLKCSDGTLSGAVPVELGVNTVQLATTPPLERLVLRVGKLKTAAESTAAAPGKLFRAAKLHPALENGCDVCHADGLGSKPNLPGVCFDCHNDPRLVGGQPAPEPHPPAADDDCLACHDAHVGRAHGLLKAPEPAVCSDCHDDQQKGEGGDAWTTEHPPVRDGSCTKCHAPHGSSTPKLLRQASIRLCLSCHVNAHATHREAPKGKGKPGSMMRTVLQKSFPLDGKKLVCAGCHRPHGSDNPRMFPVAEGELCTRCHPL